MRIDAIKVCLEVHPEKAAGLRDFIGRHAVLKMFEPPPEIEAALEINRAAQGGEPTRAWALAEQFLAREPDRMLGAILEEEFANAAGASVWLLARGLVYHRRRLSTDSVRWYEERTEEAYKRLRKSPRHRVAQTLRRCGEAHRSRLWSELRGALRQAESEGYVAGADLARRAEEIAYYDNRSLGQTRKRVKDRHGVLRERFVPFAPVSAVLEDPTLHSYDGAEAANALLDQLVARAGLTPREMQVLHYYRSGMKPKEIAARRGVAPSTIYELLRRIRSALKAAA